MHSIASEVLKDFKKQWEQPTDYRDISDYDKVPSITSASALFERKYDFEGRQQVKSYAGAFEQGKPCGKGVMTYKDGSVFSGEFKNGLKHGSGTFIKSDGSVVEGFWKKGKFICSYDD
jgi:hypothetical protein